MKVLCTGHRGYIGSVLVERLTREGHRVVGLDTGLYEGCDFGDPPRALPALRADVRDVTAADLRGFDAVIHLAALCNDPLGNLAPDCTYDINHRASVRLARLAREAGVSRFLFASSCSLYGRGGDEAVDERAEMHPVTPYGESKVLAEAGIRELADARFTPVFLRNATAYGLSPRLRMDLVVNDLVASALLTGEVRLSSDGSAWRPLVHVDDIARAFCAVLVAPREAVHDQAFNVGSTAENYRILEVAEAVARAVPGSRVVVGHGAGADTRTYRVDCRKLHDTLEGWEPEWDLARGIDSLAGAYRRLGLGRGGPSPERFLRLKQVMALIEGGRIDTSLRWRAARGAAERAQVEGRAHAGARE